jgi:hypothetical protein
MMASDSDQDISWWYFGTTFIHIDGYPEIVSLQSETIMIYRPETVSDTSYRIRWREVGYFRDPISGDVASTWLNPITGKLVDAPRSFEEGPSCYTISADGNGLTVGLDQAHAKVRSIDLKIFDDIPGRIRLTQQERKVRGFPLPDGSMPSADSGAVSETNTVLSLFADRKAIETGGEAASCTGIYTFELSSLPPWMGFGDLKGTAVVKGVMQKAALQDPLNPVAKERLTTAFPAYFTGTELTPPW